MNATEMIRAAARDGEALRRAVADAEIVPLLMCLVQLTGRTEYLDDARPYITGAWDFLQSVPKHLHRRIRADLVEAIETAAAEGREIPEAPPPALLDQMLETAIGGKLAEEYKGVFWDEASFGGVDRRTVEWRDPDARRRAADFRVVVVGAGFSGIGMAAKLKEAGIPFVVIEKNDDFGGTWLENTYPGVGVDTPCHFFSYASEPNPDWSTYFAEGDEILAYIRRCAEKHGIREHVRFSEDVTEAEYDERSQTWLVRTRRRDGTEDAIRCNALITAVGALNRPKIPAIPGRETFAGPAFHTAQWDPSVDLTAKRVAMIGTGASGMQTGPSIAPKVEKLTIFQRSPHWSIRHPLYHLPVPSAVRWAMRHIPFYSSWFRFRLFYAASDVFHHTLRMDPDWEHKDISLNAANHRMRQDLITYIKDELGERTDLLDKVIPPYPPFGKRMLRDNNWYKMLKRANVELVAGGVDRIEPDAVVANGTRHPADVIIFATGFQASRMLWPMVIRGRDGVTLRDLWGDDDPRAHLGITVPGFPNFFMVYGPNTNLAHGGSAIFHSECQIRYIMLGLRELIERNGGAVEVRQEAFEDYNRRLDEVMRTMVWSHPGMTNWYKNARGRVVMNSPWRLVDYRNMTSQFDPADYSFGRPPQRAHAAQPQRASAR